MLRNKVDEQTTLLQTAVEDRDSELDNVRALLNMRQSRDERERLQLRYNELGLSLATAQEELEEARTQAGANREATSTMARQIAVLVEDQSLRRREMDLLRRQLEASTISALDAQTRLQAYEDRPSRSSLTPAAPISTPLTRPMATPTSGVTAQLLPDPLSFMYPDRRSRDRRSRPNRDRRSRDRNDFEEDRPQRSSGLRRSRQRDDFSEERPHR